MSFQPVLPLTGYAGWSFLKKTAARQQVAQQSVPAQVRDEKYFRDKIGKVKTAEQLVGDKRLLRISLTAFGLEGDVNSKAFIQKILEGGTLTTGSLANKLADKQYLKLSAAFGFGDFSVPRTAISTFPDEILAQFRTRSFETAVGNQNNAYRLAMNAEREVPALATKTTSETSKWYTILGSTPLRTLFQTAFGLPTSFAAIDLDQQVTVMKEKTKSAFGSELVGQFSEPVKMEALVRRFLVRSEIQDLGTGSSPASIALTLLRQ